MVYLHYLQAKTISSVSSKELKAECKRFCIPYEKNSSKNDLLRSLGQKLFEEKIVQRKNEYEVISHENLINVPK